MGKGMTIIGSRKYIGIWSAGEWLGSPVAS